MAITVKASAEKLMEQAIYTADEYMHSAVNLIDKMFGNGYAKEHPELISAFMQTAAKDYQAQNILKGLETVADKIDRLASEYEHSQRD